jgi:putative NADPH-quinone reductase
MRVLYVYCHPLPESYHAALRDRARAALVATGHDVDLLDLYAEGFDPVLGAAGRRDYHDLALNRRGLERQIERLQHAEALVVQFPLVLWTTRDVEGLARSPDPARGGFRSERSG